MSLKPLAVINIVGLTQSLLGQHTPHLNALIENSFISNMTSVFPAVTCSTQASMLTGSLPSQHGIVGNGWYFNDLSNVMFWQQPNQLMQGEKVWQAAKKIDQSFTCAQLFWWYNMYADVDWSVTPRPIYPADGRKIPALYSEPDNLKTELESKLGKFPFFNFWGPKADIKSSTWIAQCAQEIYKMHQPTLNLVYLPHLDYNLQRLGPENPEIWNDVKQIDEVAGSLIEFYLAHDVDIMIVSEYGVEQVNHHININQILREKGYLRVQETLGWELLDFGASSAFAVADHQVAHIYIKKESDRPKIVKLLESIPGIEHIIYGEQKNAWGVNHTRAGDIIIVAEQGHWFTYYYWLDDNKAPDFARTVDIHRKPGYDPLELFVDPEIKYPRLKVAKRLLQKKLGMRMLMDVIPLNPALIKGSHGRPSNRDNGPLLIASNKNIAQKNIHMTDIKNLIMKHWI